MSEELCDCGREAQLCVAKDTGDVFHLDDDNVYPGTVAELIDDKEEVQTIVDKAVQVWLDRLHSYSPEKQIRELCRTLPSWTPLGVLCRAAEREKNRVRTLIISQEKYIDEFDSPRAKDCENLGTLCCWHGRYSLGDENYTRGEKTPTCRKLELACEIDPSLSEQDSELDIDNDRVRKALDSGCIMLPVYIYDHSGCTISTSPFSCRWDSGQLGFIFATADKIKKWFCWKNMSKKRWDKAKEVLEAEIREYDKYIRGEVYRYQVWEHQKDEPPCTGKEIDSCGGFLGCDHEESGLMSSAGEVDNVIEE